jgi:hypothetical protein
MGCATIEQTIYIQNVKVSGPVNPPPLHITKGQTTGTITVSPHINLNPEKSIFGLVDGHSNVNRDGIYQVDTIFNNDGTWDYKESTNNRYQFKGRNFEWDFSDFNIGVDIDIALSSSFALFGGVGFAGKNQNNLMGGSAGIGFFKETDENSLRIDFGILFQSISFETNSVVTTTTKPLFGDDVTEISFYKDRNKESNINFFSSLTYNTAFKNLPVNFFLSLSYFGQTLIDYEPTEKNLEYYPFSTIVIKSDTPVEISSSFLNITPGIFLNVTDFSRLFFGIRLLKEMQVNESSSAFIYIPTFQFDMSL